MCCDLQYCLGKRLLPRQASDNLSFMNKKVGRPTNDTGQRSKVIDPELHLVVLDGTASPNLYRTQIHRSCLWNWVQQIDNLLLQ